MQEEAEKPTGFSIAKPVVAMKGSKPFYELGETVIGGHKPEVPSRIPE
jgi:hypothetical protein